MIKAGDGSVNSLMAGNKQTVDTKRRYFAKGEKDPNGEGFIGPKKDAGKLMLGLLEDFPLAMAAIADAATLGAVGKYCRGSWRDIPDAQNRCQDARIGHFMKARVEKRCPHTGLLHLGQACWNALVELEAMIAADPDITAQYLERIATDNRPKMQEGGIKTLHIQGDPPSPPPVRTLTNT